MVKSEQLLIQTKKQDARQLLDHQSMLQERARKKAVQEQMAEDLSKKLEFHVQVETDA